MTVPGLPVPALPVPAPLLPPPRVALPEHVARRMAATHAALVARATPHARRTAVLLALVVVLLIIVTLKVATLWSISRAPWWGAYSLVVTGYILSRFALAGLYRPRTEEPGTPTARVALVVPAYNESGAVTDTLLAALASDYPRELLTVVVVDDHSTDDTLDHVRAVAAAHPELLVVASPVNGGKRRAMAAGIAAVGEHNRGVDVFVFVDSDSLVEPDALRRMVAYFDDPTVGAVAGHADVWNRDTNLLTRMQAVRYYVAFRVYKSAEALFGSVTCCSGCFSGYRAEAVHAVLDGWLHQTFLGRESTYGDDRSLTNDLLRHRWRILYAPDARSHTNVPVRFAGFLRQQLRWKKSWVRETLRACTFMWRAHPAMAVSFYLAVALPLLAPQVAFRTYVLQPHLAGALPTWYLAGVLLMALLWGLYYRLHHRERLWMHGVLFALFYTGVLVWQLPWAIATLRDSRWGTR